MSLFRKPKRNFRQRLVKFESDEEEESPVDDNEQKNHAETPTASPTNAPSVSLTNDHTTNSSRNDVTANSKSKSKEKTVKSARQNVLSFGDEEEDEGTEVFKVKKSSQSRRLAKMLERERRQKQRDKSKENVEMDDKKLDSSDHVSSGNGTKLNPNDGVVYGDEFAEIIPMDSADDEEDHELSPSSRDPFRKILESGAIPDAAMIHAARKRRQMAREMGDFIPVDDTERYEGNGSRLVRDDDNDRSDDDDDDEEEGGRLSFTVNTAARDREKVREAILSASQTRTTESGGEEVDEELERWEQEQIRKGVSIPQIQVQPPQPALLQEGNHYYTQNYYSSAGQPSSAVVSVTSTSSGPAGFSAASDSPAVVVGVAVEQNRSAWKPTAVPPAVGHEVPSLDMVRQRLQERFLSLNEVHRAHQREQEKVVDQLGDSERRVQCSEKEVPRLAQSFTFYQEMRGYVTDLVECLDEKVVQINALEAAMRNLMKQRTSRLISRRQQDIKDQADEFSKLSSKLTSTQLPDVLGRDRSQAEDTAKMRRIAEREGRRSRRRRARETKLSDVRHYEGMSSDDEEMEADVTRFFAERDRILRESIAVFDDVVDDFSVLGRIKERFEDWRRCHPDSYNEAYIGLCLPKICNPGVRLQLISWDPLREGRSFEDMGWYETLMFYGFDETAGLEVLRGDSDVNLVPMVVERIVVPKIMEIAENVWDPMSNSQTLKLVRLIKKLADEYPTVSGDSKKLTALLKAVVARIRQTLDEDVYVPLYPKALLENTAVGANAFFQRQFWSCVKLLHNIISWQGIVADGLLQELALNCLLNRYIVLALQTFPSGFDADKCHMIASVLPRSWFTRLNGERTLPQLEMFCRYLKNAASNLEKYTNVSAAGFLTPKIDPKDSLKDIIKILATIRAMDHALSLANQFSLKDLKSLVTAS